jgi:HPt (histidine-containing phosphotransfer) domain-containing protein
MTAPANTPAEKPAAPSVAASAAALDERALARLRELDPEGKNNVLPRVLGAFETSLVRMMAQLEVQRSAGSAQAVATAAHTLKSSSASVGALALSAACASTEARLRNNPNAELQSEVTALLVEAEAALRAVRAMLKR